MVDAGTAVKPVVIQAAIRRHFSQSIGNGVFDGQHGMSFAISSAIDAATITSGIAAIVPAGEPAMTGRANGAKAKPAIMTIATSLRMVIWQSMVPKSHMRAQIESLPG